MAEGKMEKRCGQVSHYDLVSTMSTNQFLCLCTLHYSTDHYPFFVPLYSKLQHNTVPCLPCASSGSPLGTPLPRPTTSTSPPALASAPVPPDPLGTPLPCPWCSLTSAPALALACVTVEPRELGQESVRGLRSCDALGGEPTLLSPCPCTGGVPGPCTSTTGGSRVGGGGAKEDLTGMLSAVYLDARCQAVVTWKVPLPALDLPLLSPPLRPVSTGAGGVGSTKPLSTKATKHPALQNPYSDAQP